MEKEDGSTVPIDPSLSPRRNATNAASAILTRARHAREPIIIRSFVRYNVRSRNRFSFFFFFFLCPLERPFNYATPRHRESRRPGARYRYTLRRKSRINIFDL